MVAIERVGRYLEKVTEKDWGKDHGGTPSKELQHLKVRRRKNPSDQRESGEDREQVRFIDDLREDAQVRAPDEREIGGCESRAYSVEGVPVIMSYQATTHHNQEAQSSSAREIKATLASQAWRKSSPLEDEERSNDSAAWTASSSQHLAINLDGIENESLKRAIATQLDEVLQEIWNDPNKAASLKKLDIAIELREVFAVTEDNRVIRSRPVEPTSEPSKANKEQGVVYSSMWLQLESVPIPEEISALAASFGEWWKTLPISKNVKLPCGNY